LASPGRAETYQLLVNLPFPVAGQLPDPGAVAAAEVRGPGPSSASTADGAQCFTVRGFAGSVDRSGGIRRRCIFAARQVNVTPGAAR
jgi:hypothetical protein